MNRTFDDVEVEPDTRVAFQKPTTAGDIPALYQQWTWAGFDATSLIFYSEDVSHLDDVALGALVATAAKVKSPDDMTMSRGEKYTFVNFNFVRADG
jgi:hypothetical protein